MNSLSSSNNYCPSKNTMQVFKTKLHTEYQQLENIDVVRTPKHKAKKALYNMKINTILNEVLA
ncbi:MAG: hypothetical protein QXP80_06515 [Zestosphaera sp.]